MQNGCSPKGQPETAVQHGGEDETPFLIEGAPLFRRRLAQGYEDKEHQEEEQDDADSAQSPQGIQEVRFLQEIPLRKSQCVGLAVIQAKEQVESQNRRQPGHKPQKTGNDLFGQGGCCRKALNDGQLRGKTYGTGEDAETLFPVFWQNHAVEKESQGSQEKACQSGQDRLLVPDTDTHGALGVCACSGN